MLKKLAKFIKFCLFIILLVLAFIIVRGNFFSNKTIAIVHNHQKINDLKIAMDDNRIEINDIDTSRMDLDMCKRKIESSDGVIFAGGNDFDPDLYGGDRSLVETYSREDDEKSLSILDYSIEHKKPILGICRGMQLINIYYGGSLYDDISKQYSKDISHRNEGNSLAYHDININPDTRLMKIAK